MKFSLEGKLTLLCASLLALVAALAAAASIWLGSAWTGALLGLALALPLATFAARSFIRPIMRSLQAVSDGIVSMKDHDFSVSISPSAQPELDALVQSYNGLGQLLRDERQS